MIGGITTGVGGPIIAEYLAALGDNDAVMLTGTRSLLAETLPDLVAELGVRAARGRSPRPVLHAYASPPPDQPDWSAADWAWYWLQFEREFELLGQPFVEVSHSKAGREHRHRLYLRVRRDGSCVGLSHNFPRQEYLSRRTEYRLGAPMIAGRFNRAVAHRLRTEGRPEVAHAMEAAGLLDRVRPSAPSTRERRQAVRNGMTVLSVGVAILTAWQISDDGPSFLASLAERGLRLEHGSRPIVVRDAAGGVHPLRRLLDRASRHDDSRGVLLAALQAKLSPAPPSIAGAAPPKSADDAIDPSAVMVAYTAAMPGYDVERDRAARQDWLDRARRDEYDTGWLPGPVAAMIESIHLVPGRAIVILDLHGRGTISDSFSRLSYRGPQGLMPSSEWWFALSRRGWRQSNPERHREPSVSALTQTLRPLAPQRRL